MEEPLALATNVWREVFSGGPFTSFKMIEVIAGLLHMDHAAILVSPETLKTFKNDVTFEDISREPLSTTWSRSTGRCTAFTFKVARLLEKRYPGVFAFEYYDIGGHRVARCKNTAVLIDSSSKSGPVVLRENKRPKTFAGMRGAWKYAAGALGHRKTLISTPKSFVPIELEAALGVCLKEIAEQAKLICLFRSISVNPTTGKWTPKYHGVVEWSIKDHCINLLPKAAHRHLKGEIKFCPEGTQETEDECLRQLNAFIIKYEGNEQWLMDGINEFHAKLWAAAVVLWRYPVWTDESAEKPRRNGRT